ncbi:hypothetical protein Btru_052097 [Bulinus truncatus]|nr:hypothetical protein Btru_052097 [Bulinus truncatus]
MDIASLWDSDLSDLPVELFLKIRNHLDIGQGWRALVANLKGITVCKAKDFERSDSPTTELFKELRNSCMTVMQFVQCAILADDHFLMDLFDVYVQAEIIQNPLNEMNVGSKTDEGEYYCAVYNQDDLVKLAISTPTYLQVLSAPPLYIKEHPQSNIAFIGGTVSFKCEAWYTGQLSYQWYKDENELEDSGFIQGSATNELKLCQIDSMHWEGNYCCRIWRISIHTDDGIFTKVAVLKIQDNRTRSTAVSMYTATEKVALLIGCYDYRSDRLLSAPRNDVQTLSTIFQSLNFKVVSLLNLTKAEMIAAVDEFSQLVWKGVYCVFYFCGHGFEVAHQCFLVPVDVPCLYQHVDCISADFIFSCLLKQEPQICCMILDICRKPYDGHLPVTPFQPKNVDKGNAIVCYGTSFGLAAYESRSYGILVHHLKNILGKSLDIESVFKMLREAISQDPKLNNSNNKISYKQIPEIKTNLLEVGRSFTDPIMYKGFTAVYQEKKNIWESAHKKPDSINLDVNFENFIVKIRLDFQQEFSNVLKIYTSVIDPGPAGSCVAYISGVPADVAEKARVKTISTDHGCRLKKNYVVIHNIQRLKKSMKINVTVICHDPDCQKTIEMTDLGLPLIARLELWKDRPHFLNQRFAEEDAETED